MFISYEDKKRIKSDLTEIFDQLVRFEARLVRLEANAEKNGYRKADGIPKRKAGRPRKEVTPNAKGYVVVEPVSGAWDGLYLRSTEAHKAAKSLAKRFPGKDWMTTATSEKEFFKEYKNDKRWDVVFKEASK